MDARQKSERVFRLEVPIRQDARFSVRPQVVSLAAGKSTSTVGLLLIGNTQRYAEADFDDVSVELLDGQGKSHPLLAKVANVKRFSFQLECQLPHDASHVPEGEFHLRVKVGDTIITKPIPVRFSQP
jgi:hypothetical protein